MTLLCVVLVLIEGHVHFACKPVLLNNTILSQLLSAATKKRRREIPSMTLKQHRTISCCCLEPSTH
jgi:hypothetical protein